MDCPLKKLLRAGLRGSVFIGVVKGLGCVCRLQKTDQAVARRRTRMQEELLLCVVRVECCYFGKVTCRCLG